jgi:hypothetical protein
MAKRFGPGPDRKYHPGLAVPGLFMRYLCAAASLSGAAGRCILLVINKNFADFAAIHPPFSSGKDIFRQVGMGPFDDLNSRLGPDSFYPKDPIFLVAYAC